MADRPAAANRSVLLALRHRLETAARGRDILDERRAVLQRELPGARAAAERARTELQARLAEARALLVRAAVCSGGDEVERAVGAQLAEASVTLRRENVMGVTVPTVEEIDVPPPPDVGPLGTSVAMDLAVERFRQVLAAAVTAAVAEERHRRLSEEARRTARRVATLDHVWLPRLRRDIRRVADALEEAERDELARTRWAASR